jgi:hypothetical protein
MNYFLAFIIGIVLKTGALWVVFKMASHKHFKMESETVFAQFVIINIVLWITVFIIWRFFMQILL